jgi:NAD+ diphosphatase
MGGPPLARSTLDRASQLRTDPVWLAEAWTRAKVLVISDGKALVAGDRLVLVTADEAPEGERLFMGVDPAGVPYFAVVAPLPPGRADDLVRPYGIREVGHVLSSFEAGLLMTAVALANWHSRHLYSPLTGAPTTVRSGGWVRADESGADDVAPHRPPPSSSSCTTACPGGGRLPARQQRRVEPGPGRLAAPLLVPGRVRRARRVGRADARARGRRVRSASP